MSVIAAVVLASAILFALILNLALRPAAASKLSVRLMALAMIGGLIYYGAGYMELSGDLPLTAVRTPVFVLRMFVGVNEFGAIKGARIVSTPIGVFGFWLAHMLAFCSMASVVMNTLGAALMRQLRIFLSRRGELTLIYGLNENSIALGKECLADGGNSVVFIAGEAAPAKIAELNAAGLSVLTGENAASAAPASIRRLHLKGRKLSVYALDEAEDKNLFFALRLLDTLNKAGVPAEKTSVTLPGAEDVISSMLQVTEERYGYGFVNVFEPAMLAARALIRMVPPWDLVSFGADGRAKEDFECVVAGFGRHGQAVLRQLVMNGQFAGSHFRAAVFSPNFKEEAGYLESDCPEMFRRYEIHSFEEDARGIGFYNYIGERLSTLKLVVVATGDPERNREISDNLMLFLKRRNAENICVVRCDKQACAIRSGSEARYSRAASAPVPASRRSMPTAAPSCSTPAMTAVSAATGKNGCPVTASGVCPPARQRILPTPSCGLRDAQGRKCSPERGLLRIRFSGPSARPNTCAGWRSTLPWGTGP